VGQNRKPSIASPNHISTGSGGLQDVPQHPEKSIDELVQEVRSLYRSKIQYDCDKIQFLNRQVPIDDLYTKVYILEDIPKLRSLDISERMQGFDPTADDPNSFYLGKMQSEPVPGLEVVTDGCKVMCLGAPGSGKTTYLSYVAIQCDKENLQANRVPIFIRLFSFAEKVAEKLTKQPQWSLFDYIEDLLGIEGIQQRDVKSILSLGRGLILLDGLDEVPKNIEKLNIFYDLPKDFDLSKLIRRRIREFCETYHKNSIIITCRTNALDYNFSNLRFTQVIVADFDDKQIKVFAKKWFIAAAKNNQDAGKAKAQQFINKLRLSKNKRIRDLAVTPILLNLTCLVFNKNDDFPSSRSELYRQALDILLKEWDTSREIPRDEVYGNLDLEGKKALLSHVAKVTFDENRYFFKQEEIEKYIADYLQTLPNAQTCRLQQDSEAVLKSIEAQHGLFIERADEIYSFSHLTFQEYFAAKWFCDRRDCEGLVKHVRYKHWREVFLLTAEMLPNADSLLQLMKREVDKLVADDEILQRFLIWINEKSMSVNATYKPVAIRFFYLSLSLDIHYPTGLFDEFGWVPLVPPPMRNLDHKFDKIIDPDLALAFTLKLVHDIDQIYHTALPEFNDEKKAEFAVSKHTDTLYYALVREFEPELKKAIEPLKEQLHYSLKENKFMGLWQANGQAWTEKLRDILIQYQKFPDFNFNETPKQLLQQYYDANKLLVDCLKSCCKLNDDDEVKEEIEETLLLPIKEIKKLQQQM